MPAEEFIWAEDTINQAKIVTLFGFWNIGQWLLWSDWTRLVVRKFLFSKLIFLIDYLVS